MDSKAKAEAKADARKLRLIAIVKDNVERQLRRSLALRDIDMSQEILEEAVISGCKAGSYSCVKLLIEHEPSCLTNRSIAAGLICGGKLANVMFNALNMAQMRKFIFSYYDLQSHARALIAETGAHSATAATEEDGATAAKESSSPRSGAGGSDGVKEGVVSPLSTRSTAAGGHPVSSGLTDADINTKLDWAWFRSVLHYIRRFPKAPLSLLRMAVHLIQHKRTHATLAVMQTMYTGEIPGRLGHDLASTIPRGLLHYRTHMSNHEARILYTEAILHGQFEAVRFMVHNDQWVRSLPIGKKVFAIRAAVNSKQAGILSYLIDEGMRVNKNATLTAIAVNKKLLPHAIGLKDGATLHVLLEKLSQGPFEDAVKKIEDAGVKLKEAEKAQSHLDAAAESQIRKFAFSLQRTEQASREETEEAKKADKTPAAKRRSANKKWQRSWPAMLARSPTPPKRHTGHVQMKKATSADLASSSSAAAPKGLLNS